LIDLLRLLLFLVAMMPLPLLLPLLLVNVLV
jgi:hypothetical protein